MMELFFFWSKNFERSQNLVMKRAIIYYTIPYYKVVILFSSIMNQNFRNALTFNGLNELINQWSTDLDNTLSMFLKQSLEMKKLQSVTENNSNKVSSLIAFCKGRSHWTIRLYLFRFIKSSSVYSFVNICSTFFLIQ